MEHKTDTQSMTKAVVVNSKIVEVTACDGGRYLVFSPVGQYLSKETLDHELRVIESLFERNYSEDKEEMANDIWKDAILNGINFLGMSSGNRQGERTRIGNRIRQIRVERGIEARDLARLAEIDAANLSRIENGRYSVGLDILSKIASVLGKKVDLVDI